MVQITAAFAVSVSVGVTPVDSPTVPKAEVASNKALIVSVLELVPVIIPVVTKMVRTARNTIDRAR